jgi:exonuclease SbcC
VRPIELTLDGFRSFYRSETFRWDRRRLVGIVGPIGSGKSSILDGISFALYGKTPRIARDVRSLVNQRRDQGTVSLIFEIGGDTWKVVRSLRRSGQPAHVLYRVEGDDLVEVADKRTDVTERIGDLLGLDFEAFRRSILLAQGEFDRFLRGTAAERDDVLKGVFGLDRIDVMREKAKVAQAAATGDLQTLDALSQSLATDRETLAETMEMLAPARSRAEILLGLVEALGALEERHRKAESERNAAKARLDELAVLGERFPEQARTDELLETIRTDTQAREHAATAFEEVLARAGGRKTLDRAGELVAVFEAKTAAVTEARRRADETKAAAATAEEAVDRARSVFAAATKEADLAEASLTDTRAVLHTAESALHDARHRDMAATLRAGLQEGEPCPVCAQAVVTIPSETAGPELMAAEAAVGAVQTDHKTAEGAVKETAAALATAAAAVDAKVEMAAELSARTAAAEEALGSVVAEHGVARAAITDLLGDGDPRRSLEDLRMEVSAAEQRIEVVEKRARSASRSFDELVGSVAALAGALGKQAPVGRDPGSLGETIAGLRDDWLEKQRRSEADLEEADVMLAAVAGEQAALIEGADLEPGTEPADAARKAAGRSAALETRAADLESRLQQVRDLEKRHQSTIERRDRYARLASDLARSKFPAFVLTERRRTLSDLGGTLFEALSGARYRFSDDGDFDVIDLAAAERRRSADSLSGGETFLASLALALALAETVAREGGRLDAFFLDEGFGSLDPDHLDLAMSGIEHLAGMADRLVVVVSHVGGLRERIEDLIALDRDPLTGDSLVVSGAEAPE